MVFQKREKKTCPEVTVGGSWVRDSGYFWIWMSFSQSASTGHCAHPRLDSAHTTHGPSSSRGCRAHRGTLGSRRGCAVARELAPRVGRRIDTRRAGGSRPARLRHPQRKRMPQKRNQPAQKGAESFASPSSSPPFPARRARGPGEEKQQRVTSPMAAPSLLLRVLLGCGRFL